MNQIISDILAEITRQNEKHGAQSMTNCGDNETRLLILASEVGEVARAMLKKDDANLYEEAVQVAACCVAWLCAEENDTVGNIADELLLCEVGRPWRNKHDLASSLLQYLGLISEHDDPSDIFSVADIAIAIAKTVGPK